MTISSNDFGLAHDIAMRCINEAADFTEDAECEYALLRMRCLYQAAPDLAEVASLALTQIKNLIDSGILRDAGDTRDELSGLYSQIQLALKDVR